MLRLEVSLPRDPDQYFGGVADADVLPDGSILVLDRLNRTIYRFAGDGRLLDSLGRDGIGPGELKGPAGLEVGPGGEIAAADMLSGRVTFWKPDGVYHASTRTPGHVIHGMWWRGSGLYLETSSFHFPKVPVSFYRLRPGVDSVGAPFVSFTFERDPETLAIRGVSCEFCASTMTPEGEPVVAAPDTLYRIVQIRDGGAVVRTWQRTGLPAVRRTTRELDALRASASRRPGRTAPVNPDHFRYKPRFASLDIDPDGRLWALRWVPDGEPSAIDVFDGDTRFLTTISVNEPITQIVVRRNRLLGIGESAVGEPTVYVYRIEERGRSLH